MATDDFVLLKSLLKKIEYKCDYTPRTEDGYSYNRIATTSL